MQDNMLHIAIFINLGKMKGAVNCDELIDYPQKFVSNWSYRKGSVNLHSMYKPWEEF